MLPALPVATIVSPNPLDVGIQRLADPNLRGIVVRQETQFAEAAAQAAGLPLELPNAYLISALPGDKKVKAHPDDPNGWEPDAWELTQLDQLLFVQEQSNLLLNAGMFLTGMNNQRPLRLSMIVKDGGEAFVVDRPFRCGGFCGCPLEMNLLKQYQEIKQYDGSSIYEPTPNNSIMIGRVVEDFDNWTEACIRVCCLCTYNHNIQRVVADSSGAPRFTTEYVVSANQCCFGPHSNMCGATCLRNDAVFFIYDKNGQQCGTIQKTYGGGDFCGAFCRMTHHYDNYIIEFPPDATTPEDRMLILTAILQLDYQLFEEKGGKKDDNNNNHD